MTSDRYWDKHIGKMMPYPHLYCLGDGNGDNGIPQTHTCQFCGLSGDYNDVLMVTSCTERSAPCEWCGEAPLCSPDCVGVRMALSDPGVYVAGHDEDGD